MTATTNPLPQSTPSAAAPGPEPAPIPTPSLVARIFPFTPLANIAANLPAVLAALAAANLADTAMLLVALATIRAEIESFLPVSEGVSPYNTSPGGAPFDLYDHRADLGNLGPPDGANFRGRGFVQLTGRANYTRFAALIGQDLVANPALANRPDLAAELLARFLAAREPAIRRALAANDLAAARRLVNGGSNGLDRFTSAFRLGAQLLADPPTTSPQIISAPIIPESV
jgi:peptidoglycan L-alanyl-D-glutamate endopeptidase CwlK